MIKPAPCPFCGKKPVVGPRGDQGFAYVRCQNTACATYNPTLSHGVRVLDRANDRGFGSAELYKLLAIRRWNRRP